MLSILAIRLIFGSYSDSASYCESGMMTKDDILTEIRRTATANGGLPLGQARFLAATGIKQTDWIGRYWIRWSDALQEAGFVPNQLQGARTDDDVLGHLAVFVGELGRFPVSNEIKLRARTDPGFPWHNTFAKFGRKADLVARLERYCRERGNHPVADICAAAAKPILRERLPKQGSTRVGYVYLVQHGSRREYKIGRTNNSLRREGELRTELPEILSPIHTIATDDPSGVERYWHMRFSDKRKNGEWFALNAEDVQAFKKWEKIS